MSNFNLLSEPIKKVIYKKRWPSLRPIQNSAIKYITETNNNYIIASRTASGKTEAAFLPILSKVNFSERGVQVLYISPLIALINDQFSRIEDLCKDLEIDVTKWHGEANRTIKKKLIKNPNGIVLITPESIEAMFVNAPYNVAILFENLKYIVIDEIHSFIGVDRGVQLTSIISRLQQINKNIAIIIGLSATIGDENYVEAKKIAGDIENTKILLDRTKKETIAKFRYFENKSPDFSINLLNDLYAETKDHKVLIFPNSRGKTEEIAVRLKKISERFKGHKNYFSHHSSVDKEIRENVEHFAKNNERFNFCISCTSTLELGIDIGSVDKIIQIDSTHSVASLVQRVGRSGRKDGAKSILNLYTTEKWNFLQSLACWNLYKKDFLEPIKTSKEPFDLLFHQMLSITKQLSGCTQKELVNRLTKNSTFKFIKQEDIEAIIKYSISEDYLESIQNEVIIGLEGEFIVNSREFYSVFKTEQNFKVLHSGRKIGEMPFSPQIKIDENVFLAAKIWKIKYIDIKGSKIEVIPAKDGKKPKFFGGGGNIHPQIRIEMLEIIKGNENFLEIDDKCISVLDDFKFDFKNFEITNFQYERPIIIKEDKFEFYTFTGTKINRTLNFLFELAGIDVLLYDEHSSLFIFENISLKYFIETFKKTGNLYEKIDLKIEEALQPESPLLSSSKFGSFLPIKYQIKIVKENYFDFKDALDLINNIQFKTI